MATQLPKLDSPQQADESLRILLADDDPDSRDYLKILLETAGHNVVEAENGREAIELYKSHKPDVVLMDIVMPEVDGYAATKIIKSIDSESHIPVIFITSLTDNNSLLKCMESGGDDFLTKPYNAILLYAKLNAHARIRNLTLGLKKRNDLLDYFRRNTEREHRIAERVFNKRLTLGQQPSTHVRYHISSMAIFNGDIYQCITASSGDTYILLGDFTGHGLAAATGTLPVSDTFISLATENQSISTIATAMNSLLKDILPGDMFCAATIMRLSSKNLNMEIWSGGIPNIFQVNRNTCEIKTIESQHLPLGILGPDDFDDSSHTHQLDQEDRLYLYTDGITETMNHDNEMFGEQRLMNLLQKYCNHEEIISLILNKITEFSDDENQQDDISIIEVSVSDHSTQQ